MIEPVKVKATDSQTYEYLIYFIFGVIDTLLSFRLLLKLTNANVGSYFVSLIYQLTNLLITPFRSIFNNYYTFEPATLVAIIVYAVLGVGIIKLIRISSGEEQPTE